MPCTGWFKAKLNLISYTVQTHGDWSHKVQSSSHLEEIPNFCFLLFSLSLSLYISNRLLKKHIKDSFLSAHAPSFDRFSNAIQFCAAMRKKNCEHCAWKDEKQSPQNYVLFRLLRDLDTTYCNHQRFSSKFICSRNEIFTLPTLFSIVCQSTPAANSLIAACCFKVNNNNRTCPFSSEQIFLLFIRLNLKKKNVQ